MKLEIRNTDSTYDLSKFFKPRLAPFRRRVGLQPRFGKDGGAVTGDKKVDARNISLSWNVVQQADIDYITELSELFAIFRDDKSPYYLVDTDNNRRAQVELESLSDRPASEGTFFRIGENTIELIMLDAYWEDLDLQTASAGTSALSNGGNLIVDNSSDTSPNIAAECFPVFSIIPTEANSEFTITNSTTGALFTISTAAFVPGTELEIDCQFGTVFLDDGVSSVELSSSFASGSGFIKLVPGENIINYASSFGEMFLDISFRRRFPF